MSTPNSSTLRNPANPPTAPAGKTGLEDLEARGDILYAAALRRKHGAHEATIRAMGLFLFVGATVAGVVVVFREVFWNATPFLPTATGVPGNYHIPTGAAAFAIGISAVGTAIGFGLRRLQAWARGARGVLSVVGIGCAWIGILREVIAIAGSRHPPESVLWLAFLSLPILMVSIYYLRLLLSPSSEVVCSPAYRAEVARTPGLIFLASAGMQVLMALGAVAAGCIGLGLVLITLVCFSWSNGSVVVLFGLWDVARCVLVGMGLGLIPVMVGTLRE